jgi:hypothetical protein
MERQRAEIRTQLSAYESGNVDAAPGLMRLGTTYYTQVSVTPNQFTGPEHQAFAREVFRRLLKVAEFSTRPDATCEAKQNGFAFFAWTNNFERAFDAADVAGACLNVGYFQRVQGFKKAGFCPRVVKLAAAAWPHLDAVEHRVEVLDAVEACSTPSTRPQNLGFLTPGQLLAWDGYRVHRALGRLRDQLAELQRTSGDGR